MNIKFINNIEEIEKRMKLKVKRRGKGKWSEGTVSEVKYEQKHLLIDNKPVRRITVRELIISCEGGEKITITPSNFSEFAICRMK